MEGFVNCDEAFLCAVPLHIGPAMLSRNPLLQFNATFEPGLGGGDTDAGDVKTQGHHLHEARLVFEHLGDVSKCLRRRFPSPRRLHRVVVGVVPVVVVHGLRRRREPHLARALVP